MGDARHYRQIDDQEYDSCLKNPQIPAVYSLFPEKRPDGKIVKSRRDQQHSQIQHIYRQEERLRPVEQSQVQQ